MRYQLSVKENVRRLRQQGWSLGQIHLEMNIPKTTVKSWVTDIVLNDEQQQRLKEHTQTALQNGRVRVQGLRKSQRLQKEQMFILQGQQDIGHFTERDLFIAGIALYWAEGFKNKHEHRLGFCNSDPYMIRFYMLWLKKVLGVGKKDLVARLTLNLAYKQKTKETENYWSEFTGIPSSQFTKTFYQNTQWKKQYIDDKYKGVLRIHVEKSLEGLWQVKGWVASLKVSLPG